MTSLAHNAAMRAKDRKMGRGSLTESRGSLYHLVAEGAQSILGAGGSCRGSRECVAGYWNSPRDWSGSERTGIPIVMPVVEAAKL